MVKILEEFIAEKKKLKSMIENYQFDYVLTQNDISVIIQVSKIRKIDFLFMSFVTHATDITKLPKIDFGKVIAKIESISGLEQIKDILNAFDGIMIARGDLGIDAGIKKMFITQYELLKYAKSHYVIMATECMLSMVNNPRPSKAEITDIGNSVVNNIGGIMLSEETAVGKYPVKCVEYLKCIIDGCMEMFREKK